MLSDKQVKVLRNDSKKKMVDVKNIEPINNIQVIREKEEPISDSDDSDDESSDLSELSELSKYKGNNHKSKPSKEKIKDHRNKSNFKPSKRMTDNDFSSFSNPKKINPHRQVESEYSESEYSSIESGSDYSGDSGESGDSINEKQQWEEKQKLKQDLLIKIQALELKGFEFSKKFNMNSNYEDMKFEYEKVKHFIETQAGIKFARRCLMACVTGIEFLNKKFDPFHIKLEGWSENVMENVNDYDNIFERLHEKYSSKAEIAPEIELLLTLGGSAFMFHLTNSLLRGGSMNMNQSSGPGGPGGPGPINPNFMQSMMGALNNSMNQMNQVRSTNQINQMNQPQGPPKPMETRGIRKEMKGPNIDQNLFAGTPLMSNYPKPPDPVDFFNPNVNQNEDDRFSIASSDSSLSSISMDKKINVPFKKNNKKVTKSGGGGFELNIN
jgi:hypothetical protein